MTSWDVGWDEGCGTTLLRGRKGGTQDVDLVSGALPLGPRKELPYFRLS